MTKYPPKNAIFLIYSPQKTHLLRVRLVLDNLRRHPSYSAAEGHFGRVLRPLTACAKVGDLQLITSSNQHAISEWK